MGTDEIVVRKGNPIVFALAPGGPASRQIALVHNVGEQLLFCAIGEAQKVVKALRRAAWTSEKAARGAVTCAFCTYRWNE